MFYWTLQGLVGAVFVRLLSFTGDIKALLLLFENTTVRSQIVVVAEITRWLNNN